MYTSGSCWTGFWLGCGIAAFAVAAAMFGPHPVSLTGVEARLKTHVERALTKAGLPDVAVEMDGQTAILTGGVASAPEQARAVGVALAAAGPGGVYAGGVTTVDNQIIVGTRVSPFSWSAEKSSAGLTIAGHVPSEIARRRLLDTARARFGGAKITDRMTLALGAPTADWTDVANDALQQLGKLKHGKVRLVDNRFAIIGEGDQAAVADVDKRFERGLAAPYTIIARDLTVTGQSLGIPELGDLNLSEASAENCQKAFAQIMRANVIEFQTGSATVDEASRGLLANLARVALRCDTYAITISGHTDNVGDPEQNMALSRARAEAVRSTLANLGVAADRLSAQGFGQTQPRAPNSTEENRARNRRIEFTVT